MGAGSVASLVGRKALLDVLRRAADAAGEGRPGVVLLEGEAGIGKTRLVTELAAEVTASGGLMLTGHCTAAGRHLAFGPWAELLRDLIRQEGRSRAEGLAGAWLPQLVRLCPDLGDRSNAPAWKAPSAGLLHEAMVGLLGRTADYRRTLVVVEDLHWSDASSRGMLDHLARVLRHERLLVLATTRTDEPGFQAVRGFLAELRRINLVSRMVVSRLPRQDVAQLVADLRGSTPDQARLDVVMQVCQGVPFLVEEAVAADVGGRTSCGSFAGDLVGHRLVGLSPAARSLIETAAVGQDPLDLGLLSAASGLREEQFETALRHAIERCVLEIDSDDPRVGRFRHALLREAAIGSLLPGARVRLHRRWARVIADTERMDPAAGAAAVAGHWLEAGDSTNAFIACLTAAAQAQRVGAYPEQARWLEKAIDLWPKVPDAEERTGFDHATLVIRTVEALQGSWQLSRARELMDSLLARGDAVDPAIRGYLQVLRAVMSDEPGRPFPLHDVLGSVALIPRQPATAQRALAVRTLARRFAQAGMPAEGLPYADEAAQIATALEDDALRAEALQIRAWVLAHLGRDGEAMSTIEEAERLADGLDLRLRAGSPRREVLWLAGRDLDAVAAARRGVELTGGDRPGALPWLWCNHMLNLIERLLELGQWKEATVLLSRLQGASRIGHHHRAHGDRLAAHLAAWRGHVPSDDWAKAYSMLPESTDLDLYELQNLLPIRYTRADIAAYAGRTEEVRRLLRPLLDEPRCAAHSGYMWPILEIAARVEGDTAEGHAAGQPSREVSDAVERFLHRMPPRNARDAAFADTVSAHLARSRGARDPTRWASVVHAWHTVRFPHRQGWAALQLAAAASTCDRSGARDALLEAVSIAQPLGARPLEQSARGVAQTLRIRLPANQPTTRPGTLPLSSRELEVLSLLAAGCSNQEIAHRLYISPKTASVHVSHILTKLGVTSRGQAAAVAHRTGIRSPAPPPPANRTEPHTAP